MRRGRKILLKIVENIYIFIYLFFSLFNVLLCFSSQVGIVDIHKGRKIKNKMCPSEMEITNYDCH